VQLPAKVQEQADAFEARIAAMDDDERIKFVGELLAWVQQEVFGLFPEGM